MLQPKRLDAGASKEDEDIVQTTNKNQKLVIFQDLGFGKETYSSTR
jgi:hypothetical protein